MLPSPFHLSQLDNTAQYVPFLSTATGFIDIFVKYVVLPFKTIDEIRDNDYYLQLKLRDFKRVSAQLFPFIGNYYLFQRNRYINNLDPYNLYWISKTSWRDGSQLDPKFKNDRVTIELLANELISSEIGDELRKNKEFIIAVYKNKPDPRQICFAHPSLLKDAEFMLEALDIKSEYEDRSVIAPYLDESLLSDENFVLKAMEKDLDVIARIEEPLLKNTDFLLKLILKFYTMPPYKGVEGLLQWLLKYADSQREVIIRKIFEEMGKEIQSRLTFLLIVMFTDNFFKFREREQGSTHDQITRQIKAKRFFKMAEKLPIELQDLLTQKAFKKNSRVHKKDLYTDVALRILFFD